MSRIQFKRTFASRHRKFCHPEFTCAARCNPDPRHDCSVANFDAGSAVTYEHKSTVFLQASLQREAPAEHAVLQLVKRKAKPNNPQAVLDVIDKFAWNSQWLMNIGDHKGAILDAAIQQHQPKVTCKPTFSATKLQPSSICCLAQSKMRIYPVNMHSTIASSCAGSN